MNNLGNSDAYEPFGQPKAATGLAHGMIGVCLVVIWAPLIGPLWAAYIVSAGYALKELSLDLRRARFALRVTVDSVLDWSLVTMGAASVANFTIGNIMLAQIMAGVALAIGFLTWFVGVWRV